MHKPEQARRPIPVLLLKWLPHTLEEKMVRTLTLLVIAAVGWRTGSKLLSHRALEAAEGPTTTFDRLCVGFKPSEEQRQRIVNCEICPSNVVTELSRPLSTEKLAMLESAVGMKLEDISYCSWGRWLRLEYEVSNKEIFRIMDNLRTVPWVGGFQLFSRMESGIPRWLYREYWLTPEEKELELASGEPIRSCSKYV
jgi:hypothetical protein